MQATLFRGKILASLLLVGVAAAAGLALRMTVPEGMSQGREWPMSTVPQDLFEEGGTRLDAAPADAPGVRVSQGDAEKLVLARNMGSSIRETKLVTLTATGPGASRESKAGQDERTVWSISIVVPGEPQCRGCTSSMRTEAIERLLGFQADPGTLSEAQWKVINADVDVQLAQYLASATDVYHIEFVDAETGEWIGGAAGFRGPN